ncbi:MAG: reductive dehalogenase [Dehalobacter sp.]|nr:reductive dehalogenase [Dehalobacter sp.]
MSGKINRRDFLKLSGLAAVGLPVGKTAEQLGAVEFVESEEKYGGFLIRQLSNGTPPYKIDPATFKRFDERNNMFGRAKWDADYKAILAEIGPQDEHMQAKQDAGIPGWGPFEEALKDGADWLRNNKGAGAYSWEFEPNPISPQLDGYSEEEITQRVKVAAHFLGASAVGVTETNENWFYNTLGRSEEEARPLVFEDVELPVKGETGPIVIPKKLNRVIVMVHEMDEDAWAPNGISLLNSSSAGKGYSDMALVASNVGAFIRALGYQAIPMGNDTGLSIPMAVDSGLGELSRMGLLVTPKFGPRVRISKVLTDLPLNIDAPITFGVREFCENCGLCAEYCPSGCIPTVEQLPAPSFKTMDINNITGVEKWVVDQKKCHAYWMECGVGCGNCISNCPFTKPAGWLHDAARILIGAKIGPLDALLANLDHASGYGGLGETPDPDKVEAFWKKNKFMHHTDKA